MRVVLLDFDGVLIPFGSLSDAQVGLVRSAPLAHVDLVAGVVAKEALEAVKGLAQYGKAKIVVISSWRYSLPQSFIAAFLARIGLAPYLHEDWCAPFKMSSSKGNDIGFWLDDHRKVKQVIVIDDEDLGLKGKKVRQIMPDPSIGLTKADLKKASVAWELDALFRDAAV